MLLPPIAWCGASSYIIIPPNFGGDSDDDFDPYISKGPPLPPSAPQTPERSPSPELPPAPQLRRTTRPNAGIPGPWRQQNAQSPPPTRRTRLAHPVSPAPIPPIPAAEQVLRRTTRSNAGVPPPPWGTVRQNPPEKALAPSGWSDDEDDDSDEEEDAEFANSAAYIEPGNYKQAMKSNEAPHWQEACTTEYNTLVENQTWEIVDVL